MSYPGGSKIVFQLVDRMLHYLECLFMDTALSTLSLTSPSQLVIFNHLSKENRNKGNWRINV